MSLNIEKTSLKEKIVSALMEKIINGEIEVGDKLKEAHLAKAFGVSQAPVREAIISLVSLGILEHKPNVGARVKEFDRAETIEIYEVRDALEVYAVGHIVNFDKLDDLKDAYACMLKASEVKDIKLFVEHDKAFHSILIEMSGNSLILELWTQQYTKSSVHNVLKGFTSSLDEIIQMHLPIIEAIESASSVQCEQAVNAHYKKIIKNIKDKK